MGPQTCQFLQKKCMPVSYFIKFGMINWSMEVVFVAFMKKTEKLFILRDIVENVHYTILLHVNGIKRCMIRQSRNANFRAQSATQLVSIYLQYRVVDFFFSISKKI